MGDRQPHTISETAAAYVEASQRIGSSRHGAAGTMPLSTVNAGIGFQILKDRPDLAENVTRLRADGSTTAHGITLHVDGDGSVVEAWVEFLGPAAHVHPQVPFLNGWEQAVTTVDTCVIVRHQEKP